MIGPGGLLIPSSLPPIFAVAVLVLRVRLKKSKYLNLEVRYILQGRILSAAVVDSLNSSVDVSILAIQKECTNLDRNHYCTLVSDKSNLI
jgi:hypothetical protein